MKVPRGVRGVVAVLCLAVIMAAVIVFFVPRTERSPRPPDTTLSHQDAGKAPGGGMAHRDAERSGSRKKWRAPAPAVTRMAIIIDDIGYNLAPVRELLEIDAPLTFAILPPLNHSADAAEMVYRAGKEILLHLPMEPHAYPDEDPGPGALFLRMSDDEIRRQVEKDIKSVPHGVGVNNHMGSRFMEDGGKLALVMNMLKEKGFFFIDSRTTRHSRGREMAVETGIRFASRVVFLDNDHNQSITMRNLIPAGKRPPRKDDRELLMIGHPYPETIRALKSVIPALKAQGAKVVPASELAKTMAPEAP